MLRICFEIRYSDFSWCEGAPNAPCLGDRPACGAGKNCVGAASSSDLQRAMTALLSFRSSRPGHFSRVCGRGKAPPPCSPRCFAATSQGLPRPQPRKWLRPPAVTPEERSSPAPGTRGRAAAGVVCSAKAHSRGIDSGERGRAFQRVCGGEPRRFFSRRRKEEAPDALCATDPPACGAGRFGGSLWERLPAAICCELLGPAA